jgi:hypothetical protein
MGEETGSAEDDVFTDDERTRIEAFLDKPRDDREPDDLVPDTSRDGTRDTQRAVGTAQADDEAQVRPTSDGTAGHTGPAECREIRDRMAEAVTAKEVVEAFPDLHVSTIMRHAYGNCSCEIERSAVASPQIRRGECREFRDRYRDGYPPGEIAEDYGRSANSVTRHVFGRCSHEVRHRDVSPSEVEERECKRLRESYRRSEKIDHYAVAAAMRLRREVASYHLFGLCDCSHNQPPAEEKRPLDDRRFITPEDPDDLDGE